jgi:hypothetical protein
MTREEMVSKSESKEKMKSKLFIDLRRKAAV